MKGFVAAVVAAFLVSGAADAAVTLDQSSLYPATNAAAYVGYFAPADTHYQLLQSVTAGLTGTLAGIDLQMVSLYGTGTVTISVITNFAIDGDVVTGTTRQVAAFSLDALLPLGDTVPVYTIDMSAANIALTSGDHFAILAQHLGSDGAAGWGVPANGVLNDYAGGAAYGSDNGGLTYQYAGQLGFQTFVDTAAPISDVPEPVTWAMFVGGFGLVGGALRHRRRGPAAA